MHHAKNKKRINLLKRAILNQPEKGNSSKLFSLEIDKSKLENRSTISTVKLPGIHQHNRKRKVHEVVYEANDRCSSKDICLPHFDSGTGLGRDA